MIKQAFVAISLAIFSGTISAQQADPCSELAGSALGQCRGNQQKLQQQQLEQLQQQLQQQQERQKQLDEQQRQIQDQLENMRLQNEVLRKQLEREKPANQPTQAQAPATDFSKTPEANSWRTDNPWYGSDYAKTEFAMRYAKQLRQERPDLIGRAFYDAVSAKVNETFGAKK
jgi:TolA-binding protein